MARKKGSAAPRPKLPSSVHSSPTVDQNPPLTPDEPGPQESKIDATQSDDFNDYIDHQCKRVSTYYRRGNHIKALKLMKELCSRYPNSARVHAYQARIYCMIASEIKDPVLVQKHLKNAVEAARRGASLSPNSIMLAFLYARLLHDTAKNDHDFEETAHVCRRAIDIEKPVDPLKDRFLKDNRNQESSPEARIAEVQIEIKGILKSCYASHSFLWRAVPDMAKNDEVRSSARLKPLILDPEVLKIVETNKQSEVVEPIKQSDPSLLINEEEVVSKPLSRFHRLEEKRKHTQLKKAVSSSLNSIDQIRSYWNNLGVDKRKGFTKVKIEDLKAYLGSLEDDSHLKVFLEAVSFAKKNKTWKFWSCPCCSKTSKDFESSMRHLSEVHLQASLESILPKEVDKEWAKILTEDIWNPIDTEIAPKMIENQSESQSSIFCDSDENDCMNLKGDSDTCSIEDKMQKLTCGFEDSDSKKIYSENRKWQFSDDAERITILQEIKDMILLLRENRCLSQGTINKLVNHCRQELESLISDPKLLNQALNDFPLCMCFLDAFRLKKIFKFLEAITQFCDFSQGSVEDNSIDDDSIGDIKERVVFSNDFSTLEIGTYDEAVSDGSAAVPAIEDGEDDNWICTDKFITWLRIRETIDDHSMSWYNLVERKRHLEVEIFVPYDKEWQHVLDICELQHMVSRCEKVIYEVYRMCFEEQRKSVPVSNGAPFNCQAVLLKKQKELVDSGLQSNNLKLEYIGLVLEQAQAQSMECSEDIVSEILHYNVCIGKAIWNVMERLNIEFYSYEARILRSLSVMHQLELKFKQFSEQDYRSIIINHIKNFTWEHLKDLAKKYAAEKSDVATEVLLKELALDSQKIINKGGENKKKRKKSKDKQRRKGCTKATSLKESRDSDQLLLHPDSAEQAHFFVESDGDCPDSDIGASVRADDLKQFNENVKDEIDIDAMARKLEEFVEYQKQYENEAKHARLAKENITTNVAAYDYSAESMSFGFSEVLRDPFGVRTLDTFEGNITKSSVFGTQESEKKDSLSKVNEDRGQAHEERRLSCMSGGEECEILPNDGNVKMKNSADLYGTGLKNDFGEYNCFLNVIIQSLWHLRRFRDEFMSGAASLHFHVGDPCVVCALYDIFTALSNAARDMSKEAVAPSSLRIALSNFYPDSNFFLEGQMNDASEVLGVVFHVLHMSSTSTVDVSDTIPIENKCRISGDCSCLAHRLFGMDISERMNCESCGLESRHLDYSSFFHNINTNALRDMKILRGNSSFAQLLKLVEMNDKNLPCDPDGGGCGKLNNMSRFLSNPPHVFTTVLGWQTTAERPEDISATLATLTAEMDISFVYEGLEAGTKYCLVSVVCYYGMHYICFAYSKECETWILCDDNTVEIVGSWDDVVTMCENGHYQPQVLFFEAV